MNNTSIKINFILPFKPRRPAGGFRVMYEYANRLVQKGYQVHLIFPIETRFMKYRFPYLARYVLSKIEGFRTNKWFNFDTSITMSYAPRVANKYIPDADIVIATWWATVLDMSELETSKGKKINLIQGYENWEGHEVLLHQSYDLPDVTNIAVATFLKEIVKNFTNKKIELIPNAISNKDFFIENAIEKRSMYTVAMTYSTQEIKGSKYGIEALELVKSRIPELKVECFGVCPKPSNLPAWITFHRNPSDLRDLYNRNAIFISNSFTEGFSLVSAESMFCGCALVCTDIGGHREYAIDEETALLVETGNAREMAEKIYELINNSDKRFKLAQMGNKYIQRFEWNNAVNKMQNVVSKLVR